MHVKTTDVASKAKHRRQPAAHNRTNNPENTGQNEAAAIVSRMMSLAIAPAIRPKIIQAMIPIAMPSFRFNACAENLLRS